MNYRLQIMVLLAWVLCLPLAATAQSQRSNELFSRGVALYEAGLYARALPLFAECDSLDRQEMSELNARQLYASAWRAACLYRMGRRAEAQAIDYDSYLEPVDRRLTTRSDSLCTIGNQLFVEGDLTGAADYYLRCADVERAILGEQSAWYGNSLANVANCLMQLGDSTAALDYARRAYAIGVRTMDAWSPSIDFRIVMLENLYDTYQLGEFAADGLQLTDEALTDVGPSFEWYDALRLRAVHLAMVKLDTAYVHRDATGALSQAVDLCVERHGLPSQHAYTTMSMAINIWEQFGQHAEAAETALRYVNAARSANQLDTLALSMMMRYANDIKQTGQWQQGLESATEALSLAERLGFPLYLANAHEVLAGAYADNQDYRQALEHAQKAVEAQKSATPTDSVALASSMSMLGSIYRVVGDYPRAMEIYNQLIDLTARLFGAHSIPYLRCYVDVLDAHAQLFPLTREELDTHMNNALAIVSFLSENPKVLLQTGQLLNFLSSFFDLMRIAIANGITRAEIKQFIPTIQGVLALGEVLGETHPLTVSGQNLLASCLINSEQYEEAIQAYLKLGEMQQAAFGQTYAGCHFDLANAYILAGRPADGLEHARQALESMRGDVQNNFRWMTAQERSNYWYGNSALLANLPTLAFITDGQPGYARTAYDALLLSRGVLLNSELELQRVLAESGDAQLLQLLAQWRQLKLAIDRAHAQMQGGHEAQVDVSQLASQANLLERQLVSRSAAFGDFTSQLGVKSSDVQGHLSGTDVAIEFSVTTYRDVEPQLMAFVLTAQSAPRMVKLCALSELEAAQPQAYSGDQVFNLVWAPLQPYLATGTNVYFAADGPLHTVAIEHVPGTEPYHLFRLSSTRELAKPAQQRGQGAALYGGIDYAQRAAVTQAPTDADGATYRDVPDLRLLRGARKTIPYLPGSRLEVEAIDTLLRLSHVATTLRQGVDATEESFKHLAGRRLGLLHLSTHGFYQRAEDATANEQPAESAEDQALSRAGLFLSGAAKSLYGGGQPADQSTEDGILTAREISRLDLRGLDLVVLSACETGLGDVSGEGVFGLQRGFKKAGAQTLLMSLWKVDDTATQLLMTEFYRQLTAGLSKRAAFQAAQRYLRQHDGGRYDHPEYWAAFVMLDAL